ncbi:hypothetical protein H0E87_016378 [Populus deltoides]|uniref:Uncharacterized protein n=1 Tax=Populus deltoides TaxID=3696 RepID=A0A8T2Y921_POPDE|nr:hypothetical protein H0E87_016378 [Populus deltoides]
MGWKSNIRGGRRNKNQAEGERSQRRFWLEKKERPRGREAEGKSLWGELFGFLLCFGQRVSRDGGGSVGFLSGRGRLARLKGEETENQDPLQPGVSLVLVPKAKREGRGTGDRGSLPTAVGKKKMVAFHWEGNENSEIVGGDGSRGIGGTGTERGGDWEGNGNSELLKGKCVMNNKGNGRGMEQWEIIQTGYNRGNEE